MSAVECIEVEVFSNCPYNQSMVRAEDLNAVCARIDAVFKQHTGIRSRTKPGPERTLAVHILNKHFLLIVLSKHTPPMQYLMRTREIFISVQGPDAGTDAVARTLLERYLHILITFDHAIDRAMKDQCAQAMIVDTPFTTGKGISSKECRFLITFRCNQRCIFCPNIESRDAVTLSELKRQLDIYYRANRTIVSKTSMIITGGEPTLSKHLLPIIRYAKQKKFASYTLQTNGVLLASPERVRAVYRAGIDSIVMSLHAYRAKEYDRITGTHGQYPLVQKAIRNVLEVPFRTIMFNMVLNKHNIDLVQDHIRFLLQLTPRHADTRVIFFPAVVNDNPHWEEVAIPYSLVVKKLAPVLKGHDAFVQSFTGDCAMPVCVGGLYKKLPLVRSVARIDSPVFYSAQISAVHIPAQLQEPRVKREECRQCRFDRCCAGVPVKYARRFGLKELAPVRGRKKM